MNEIIETIKDERLYQNTKWGTAFDDKNTINDWAAYVNIYMSRATSMNANPDAVREGFMKAASILVAALESCDRNNGFPKRHYDKAVV